MLCLGTLMQGGQWVLWLLCDFLEVPGRLGQVQYAELDGPFVFSSLAFFRTELPHSTRKHLTNKWMQFYSFMFGGVNSFATVALLLFKLVLMSFFNYCFKFDYFIWFMRFLVVNSFDNYSQVIDKWYKSVNKTIRLVQIHLSCCQVLPPSSWALVHRLSSLPF